MAGSVRLVTIRKTGLTHLWRRLDNRVNGAHNKYMTTTQTQRIAVGSKVEGSYLGAKFTGTVTSHRAHTINHLVFLTCVDLDAPVEIKMIDRTEDQWLMVSTAWDGSPCPPEAGDWGDTGDYVSLRSE